MFNFHSQEANKNTGLMLSITLPNGIDSEYHSKLDLRNCTFASDIVWGEENLCAAIQVVNLDLALFLIRHKEIFNVSTIMVIGSNTNRVPELSLLDGIHKTPLEFLALFNGSEQSSTSTEDLVNGDNDSDEE